MSDRQLEVPAGLPSVCVNYHVRSLFVVAPLVAGAAAGAKCAPQRISTHHPLMSDLSGLAVSPGPNTIVAHPKLEHISLNRVAQLSSVKSFQVLIFVLPFVVVPLWSPGG